jgi:hypothetical protein
MHPPRTLAARLFALLEGVGWLFLYWAAQLAAALAFLVSMLLARFGAHVPSSAEFTQFLNEPIGNFNFVLIATSSLGPLFVMIPLVWLRLGKQAREYLELKPLHRDHVIFALAMIIPVGVLGDALHQVAEGWWLNLTADLNISDLWKRSMVHDLHRTFQGAPYFALVVVVALGPAIGEEIVFRGAIGKRMVAAWGVPLGVIFTSLLFAAAHMSPPHAIATIPIAIAAHLLYLHTRTIWAPILMHLGNNLLAVSLVHFEFPMDNPATPEHVVAAICYLGLLVLAWHWNSRLLEHNAPRPLGSAAH